MPVCQHTLDVWPHNRFVRIPFDTLDTNMAFRRCEPKNVSIHSQDKQIQVFVREKVIKIYTYSKMLLQIAHLGETFLARRANERLFARVRSQMDV